MLKAQKILSFSLLGTSILVLIVRLFSLDEFSNIFALIIGILNTLSIIGSILNIVIMIIYKISKNKKELFNKNYLIINICTIIISFSSYLYLIIDFAKNWQNF